jgi:hypothetical protein
MYGLADLIAVGLGCLVFGFGLAVAVTLPALKKSARKLGEAEAQIMVLKRSQAGVDYRRRAEGVQQKSLADAPPHRS